MSRYIRAFGAAALCFTLWTCRAKEEHKTPSLCTLAAKTARGAHINAQIQGIYEQGLESTTLRDPACPNVLTWIEFALQTKRNWTKLQGQVDRSGEAYVFFEGEFYGPPLPDHKLPEPLRKAFPPLWGHMSCCPTRLVVHSIQSVSQYREYKGKDVPGGRSH